MPKYDLPPVGADALPDLGRAPEPTDLLLVSATSGVEAGTSTVEDVGAAILGEDDGSTPSSAWQAILGGRVGVATVFTDFYVVPDEIGYVIANTEGSGNSIAVSPWLAQGRILFIRVPDADEGAWPEFVATDGTIFGEEGNTFDLWPGLWLCAANGSAWRLTRVLDNDDFDQINADRVALSNRVTDVEAGEFSALTPISSANGLYPGAGLVVVSGSGYSITLWPLVDVDTAVEWTIVYLGNASQYVYLNLGDGGTINDDPTNYLIRGSDEGPRFVHLVGEPNGGVPIYRAVSIALNEDVLAVATNLDSHEASTSNPHAVTAAQVGAVATTRTITSGAGLTGGGALSGDLTLDIGAGTGITVNANDVAITAGGVTATQLASDAVTTVKILDANVTLAKLADAAAHTILTRSADTTGVVAAQSIGTDEGLFNVAGVLTSQKAKFANLDQTVKNGIDPAGKRSVPGNITIDADDNILLITASADITLPAASDGRVVRLQKATASVLTVNIVRAGSEKIQNVAATYPITEMNSALYVAGALYCDGTDWWWR